MKKIVILFFFVLNIGNGQDGIRKYQPFSFENYKPKWQHLTIDSSIIGDTLATWTGSGYNYYIYDGWSHFTSLFPGKYLAESDQMIYFLKNNAKDHFEGGFVECLDKTTGDIKWSNSFDLRSNSNKEYPYYIRLDDVGNVEIGGYRKLDRDSTLTNFWARSTLFKRTFNATSGDIMSYLYGNEYDSLNQIVINYNTISFNTNTVSSYLFPIEDNIQQINVFSYGGSVFKSNYKYKELSDIGYSVKNGEYEVPFMFSLPRFSKISKISEDSTLLLRYSTVSSFYNRKDSFNLELEIVDRDFNSLKIKNLSGLVYPSEDFRLGYVNEESFVIVGREENSGDDTEDFIILHFHLFDIEGNLLEVVSIKDNFKLGEFDLQNTNVIKLRNEDKMLFISSGNGYFEDGYSSLNFYKSDGKGNLDTLKILKVNPKNHKILPGKIYQLENNDIILDCKDRNLDYPSIPAGSAGVLICFRAEDLGIKTAVMDYSGRRVNNIIAYPNPVKNTLNIYSDEDVTGTIRIYDNFGRLVICDKINGRGKIIDVSKLNEGIYSLKVKSDKGVVMYEKFVKD